jgi:hypothetical protein
MEMVVEWPSGRHQVVSDVTVDELMPVVEHRK